MFSTSSIIRLLARKQFLHLVSFELLCFLLPVIDVFFIFWEDFLDFSLENVICIWQKLILNLEFDGEKSHSGTYRNLVMKPVLNGMDPYLKIFIFLFAIDSCW